MRFNFLKGTLKTAVVAVTILLFGVGMSFGQATVNLTAGAAQIVTPDGNTVPMWGFSCTGTQTGATCANLDTMMKAGTTWSPVVITVPVNASGNTTLTISLQNSLSFVTTGGTNNIPTSIVIVGQLGGGLGTPGNYTNPPDHSNAQTPTWPITGAPAGQSAPPANTPPLQGPRVQSFGKEIAGNTSDTLTWSNLKPGTYLLESGTHPSIQGPMGLYGILVVTTAPGTSAGTAYPNVSYNGDIPLLFSEIDPVQNTSVQAAVNTANFKEDAVWSGLPGGCGNPSSTTYLTCYPPAVNYTPLYYLINGVAFDKTFSTASVFQVSPAASVTGNVLVRMVNAGLRMHVPSIVGATTAGASAVPGFGLIAEDGNPLPGVTRVQSEVFMPAGKTYDVMINAPAAAASALPIFDRELSLSGNGIGRDAGMLAYISVNGSKITTGIPSLGAAAAADDNYTLVQGTTLTVSDPGKGVIANDTNVYGVRLLTPAASGTVTLNGDGTFTYVPTASVASDSFTYCANGTVSGTTCSSGVHATVNLGACTGTCLEANTGITMNPITFNSNVATHIAIAPPGILVVDSDHDGHPLTVAAGTVSALSGPGTGTLAVDPNGGFQISSVTAPGTYTFTYKAQNSQGTQSSAAATVTVVFPTGSGLVVNVVDGKTGTPITDYRWVIEEDRTFFINPATTTNTGGTSIVPTFGTNFHTSYMPLVATGCIGQNGSAVACESGQSVFDPRPACTSPGVPAGCSATGGQHIPTVCDIGNGICRMDGSAVEQAIVDPASVALDATKHYYISVLPGDAGNPFIAANLAACPPSTDPSYDPTQCGHGMGGAPIAPGQKAVTILSQPSPYPPSKLSVFVFEDDFPLNGEQDGGGGIDVLSPNEGGLGGFNITLFDDAGGTGDATGQMTYDMFNQPLVNSLAGTPDPANSNIDACPVSVNPRQGVNDPNQTGITGTIVTCPKYEADGVTLSPLAGQAVVANLMPGRYGVVATPAADRIGRGEEWLQTNTLDGQKAHDSFLRIGEPSFFQEFGPAGYHVSIGFANPSIINGRKASVCSGNDPNLLGTTNCNNSIHGLVSTERMSRTPDERLYSSGDNSSFAFTQCYVSFGDADGMDFSFTKCNADGTFSMSGLPDGDWRVTVFDQWNDMLVDGLSTPVRLGGGADTDMGQIAMNQWQANLYTSTFFDNNHSGVMTDYKGPACTGTGVPSGCNPNFGNSQPGLTLVATNIRFRDGSYSNFNNTDLGGNAGFNEVFPLFSWYVVETDTTRYKSTGVHVVYDAGGPADGNTCTDPTAPCGSTQIAHFMANTAEQVSVPTNLRVPGAKYCKNADCPSNDAGFTPGAAASTGRIDPAWVQTEGWQGFSGQNSFIEFGKAPFVPGETGGIHGEVIYASTRPFDDPSLLLHTSWTPDVPGVTINLYQEGTAPDGTTSLKLIDTTKTSSWDDWAQGFRSDKVPNMNCPGQLAAPTSTTAGDVFFFSLFNQPMWLDQYNNVLHPGGTGTTTALPNNSQFKCYDGMHNWNQVQPAPYDGMYSFPSVTAMDPTTGEPTATNCTACVTNPDVNDKYRYGGSTTSVPWTTGHGAPMLPAGKYVVEMIVPPGYELVKEEDKNILIGDNYIAPVTQEFPNLATAIYILPDQAEVSSLYNATNPQNPTQTLGRTSLPSHEGDTGSIETFWPCVGAKRVVPDYISLFPQSGEVSPFAGALRNLCDRKEVTLDDQTSALAKFWIFTSAHVAAHFTGVITDDFTSEFDPFSPQFGEKFSPPDMPISVKDWSGTEISRVYADHWGTYDGLTYSTWEVNPPNPTGYAPTMMVTCMNDPGPILDPAGSGQMITDPLYNPQYSQFCYEIPFMPGQTQYMDTPVVPTSAFAGAGYNNPDCAYPGGTTAAPGVPAIKEVDGDGIGPWVDVGKTSIASITLKTPGSGYTSAPSNFSIPGGTTAATGQVTDLTLVAIASFTCSGNGNNRCSNYATHPTVTITGGGGSGATATATKTGSTISFSVTAGGSGYTSRPTIRVSRLSGGSNQLSNSSASMGVNGIVLTGDGAGYAGNIANFTISGGSSGNLATASATVGTSNQQITITALGDVQVPNYAYSGPQQTTAPYNQKTVLRHYGFGTAKGTVQIGGVNVPAASITTWNDTTIILTVPAGVPGCAVQQQAQYGGSFAECGQLFIVTANGSKSIDTVTVTVGGKHPTHVASTASVQSAIDTAEPGDLIIIDPNCTVGTSSACNTAGVSGVPTGATVTTAAHNELLLMWKPVRLQGVGAESSVINANTHPAGKLDTWRREVNCLFGLAMNGQPYTSGTNSVVSNTNPNPYDSTGNFTCPAAGWNEFKGQPNVPQVDRLPLEAAVGWDATQNGNLAELLQEPTLMGALEGAGITVLSKGLDFHGASPWTDGNEAGGFPAGTTLLQNVNGAPFPSSDNCRVKPNPFPSNFMCNPSSIDGLTVTDSSQGGGGIYVHGWSHNLQIANNRVRSNSGTLSGGINVGQGEFPGAYITGSGTNAAPDSCLQNLQNNQQQPYCFDLNVNMHHNSITSNSATGDELFSATPAGAGGVSICNGSDYYKFNNNWVCGNLSTGDGGGVAHIGYSWNGDIENNMFLFNQSTNPTIPTNGGGLLVMGAPDVDPACGATTDQDCVSAPSTISPSDGTGPGMVINANLFLGNSADSGSGGGIRFQNVNGTDVITFATRPSMWYTVNVTNNVITNNVAGWDGAGISLQDALAVNIVNNTIASNDTTASSGVLFNTLGAPLASSSGPTCTVNCGTTSKPQPAGLVSIQNSAVLVANMPANTTCPGTHPNCKKVSYPLLENNVFWQNRAFYIGVGALGTGTLNQQNVVSLYKAFGPATLANQFTQPTADATTANGAGTIITGGTGACDTSIAANHYWDLGVRGDTGPENHASTVTLNPTYSVITDTAAATGYNAISAHNSNGNPILMSQYCNGSRIPPELGKAGYQVPPGISDATVPNPLFNLTPNATVDEGNNWINMAWGPLSLFQPINGKVLGNYAPASTSSSAVGRIPSGTQNYTDAPSLDYFGNARKNGSVDAGAIEFAAGGGGGGGGNIAFSPTSHDFGSVTRGLGAGIFCIGFNVAPCQVFTLTNNTGATVNNVGHGSLSGDPEFSIVTAASTCGAAGGGQLIGFTSLNNGQSCVVTVQFRPPTGDTTTVKNATVSVTDSAGTQSATMTGTPR